MINMHFFFK